MTSRTTRALALGATLLLGMTISGTTPSAGAVSSGDRAVFVPITPCRLVDTRPGSDNVGSRSTPVGEGETFTIQARGTQGKCELPAETVALAMNVAVIGGTKASFLTVFPAGTSTPLAANLNWVAGQPPTPNKVDVGLAVDGRVSFYNFAGSVDIAADVTGYYLPHDHDDRYYTKGLTDAKFAAAAADAAAFYATKTGTYTKAEADAKFATQTALAALQTQVDGLGSSTSGRVAIPGAVFSISNPVTNGAARLGGAIGGGIASNFSNSCWYAPVDVPNGVQLGSMTPYYQDNNNTGAVRVTLFRKTLGGSSATVIAQETSTDGFNSAATQSPELAASGLVDLTTESYYVEACFKNNATLLYDVVVIWGAV